MIIASHRLKTEASESENFVEKSDLEFHFCPYGEYHKVECRQCFSSCSLRLVNAFKIWEISEGHCGVFSFPKKTTKTFP